MSLTAYERVLISEVVLSYSIDAVRIKDIRSTSRRYKLQKENRKYRSNVPTKLRFGGVTLWICSYFAVDVFLRHHVILMEHGNEIYLKQLPLNRCGQQYLYGYYVNDKITRWLLGRVRLALATDTLLALVNTECEWASGRYETRILTQNITLRY